MFALAKSAWQTRVQEIWQPTCQLRSFSASAVSSWVFKYSKNPVIRREQYDRHNAWVREKYAQDPALRAERAERAREIRMNESQFEAFKRKRRSAWYGWLTYGLKRGIVRSWETYTPEYSLTYPSEPRRCLECDNLRRRRLWWKLGGNDVCNICFAKDWSRMHPIGYEHLTFTRKSKEDSATTPNETSDQAKPPAESKP